MPNSDNTYGVHNKRTKIISQTSQMYLGDDNAVMYYPKNVWSTVDEAKNFIFTSEALAVIDETCTRVEYQVVNDGDGNATQLKMTWAFGTKGGNIAAADDWAEKYLSRKNALLSTNSWTKNPSDVVLVSTDSTDHLF